MATVRLQWLCMIGLCIFGLYMAFKPKGELRLIKDYVLYEKEYYFGTIKERILNDGKDTDRPEVVETYVEFFQTPQQHTRYSIVGYKATDERSFMVFWGGKECPGALLIVDAQHERYAAITFNEADSNNVEDDYFRDGHSFITLVTKIEYMTITNITPSNGKSENKGIDWTTEDSFYNFHMENLKTVKENQYFPIYIFN